MGRLMVFIITIVSLCVGCSQGYRDTTLYQRSGCAKPIIAVMPTIDNTEKEYSVNWNVAHELTEEIRRRIFDSPKLYLLREGGNLEVAKQLNVPSPAALTKKSTDHLGAAEFVVVTELIDQHETPYGLTNKRPRLEEVGSVLTLAMRVRVIDLRGAEPKVILQEVVNYDHTIARAYLNTDYVKAYWGTEAFDRTPMGMAHSKLIREVVARVEGYIGASKG